jgi:hypothetical protein
MNSAAFHFKWLAAIHVESSLAAGSSDLLILR